mmetsp:Transcript_1175/g.1070  ORF Transcript_1175/g.1070 Transcript_1175/m.1070 type:complete len:189 (-) Transcript_1175:2282-2848(-)
MPPVKLCGHAIMDDDHREWRSEVEYELDMRHRDRFINEIIDDIMGGVRTPPPESPDLEDPEVWRVEFEEKNQKYNLYYTPIIMGLFKNLRELVYDALKIDIDDPEYYWDLDVDYIKSKINEIKDDFTHEAMMRRYKDIFNIAKKKPLDRSSMYPYCRKIIEEMASDFEETSNTVRREKDVMEYHFQEP